MNSTNSKKHIKTLDFLKKWNDDTIFLRNHLLFLQKNKNYQTPVK